MKDIAEKSALLEKTKLLGTQVVIEANTEGKLKVGKTVHGLEMRFYCVEKVSQERLKSLKVVTWFYSFTK